jgi:hypothetical protein
MDECGRKWLYAISQQIKKCLKKQRETQQDSWNLYREYEVGKFISVLPFLTSELDGN